MNDTAIYKPGEDVTIDGPHRGDITCRLLTIRQSGSVFGHVVAHEVRVAGRIDGTVHATNFYAAAGSKVFGSVNAAEIGIKPGTSLLAYLGPEFPIQQFRSPSLAANAEARISNSSPDGEVSVSADQAAQAEDVEMGKILEAAIEAAVAETPAEEAGDQVVVEETEEVVLETPAAAVAPASERQSAPIYHAPKIETAAPARPKAPEAVVIAAVAAPVRKTLPPLI